MRLAANGPSAASEALPAAEHDLATSVARGPAAPRRPRRALILLTIVQMLVAVALLEGFSGYREWGAVHGEDSHGYLVVARHLAGEPTAPGDLPALRYRLFNPLVPAAAALLGAAIGIVPAFLLLGAASWMAAALLVHALLRREGPRVAWIGAAIFTTSLPLVEWGLPVMLDSTAWALAAGGALLARRWRTAGGGSAVGLGVLAAVAVLVKPTLVVLALHFVLLALRDRRPWRALTVAGVGAAGALATYVALGLGGADFVAGGTPRHRGLVYLLAAALFCYHWGWLPAIANWRRRGGVRDEEVVWALAFLPQYLLFVHSPRLFFLGFPAVLPALARGIAAGERRLRPVVAVLLLPAYVFSSNLLAAAHLYVMRVLAVRSVEGLLQQLRG